jgi:hypothetical protein
MQQRRPRPGDVLDDYCPRERRITDHAIVAMIDDTIQQTRCVVCDTEHQYKQAKVPPQRKKKTPALFTQVLDGLKAPARPADQPEALIEEPEFNQEDEMDEEIEDVAAMQPAAAADREQADVQEPVVTSGLDGSTEDEPHNEEGVDGPLFRRRLIRAALPRPEGTPPPTRAMPEFTMRQPLGRNRHGRGHRGGGQHQGQGFNGPMRFGRDGHGQRSNGHGRPGGHRGHGGQGGPATGSGRGPSTGSGRGGNRAGGSRRGGKKR